MEKCCAISHDVKAPEVEHQPLTAPDLPLAVLLEIPAPPAVRNSQTGLPTHSVPQPKEGEEHWYALRTTYGREHKVYDYLVTHGVEPHLPLLKSVKMVDGKRTTVEESRIPNIFLAYGTEDELKTYVLRQLKPPFLRFYYRRMSVCRQAVSAPLIVPGSQMDSMKTIFGANCDDVIATPEVIGRLKEGMQMRITDGEFKGVTGRVARYQSQQRVEIIIERPTYHLHRLRPQCFF